MIDAALALLLSPYAPWAVAGLSLAALILVMALAERRFRRRIRAVASATEPPSRPPFKPLTLLLRRRHILLAARGGFRDLPGPFPDLPERLGLVERWTDRLARCRGGAGTMRLALEFAPDRAIFPCMLQSIGSRRRSRGFQAWLEGPGGDFALRRVALSSRGMPFDSAEARELLGERLEDGLELFGDPEWAVRVFAVRLFTGEGSSRSEKAILDALSDPHPLARRLSVEGLSLPADLVSQTAFETELARLRLDDPSSEVREAAKKRLSHDFPASLAIDPATLDEDQATHVLESLDMTSDEDERVAFHYLAHGKPGERLAAAEHLDARGSLARLLLTADRSNPGEFEHRAELLANAAALGSGSFLAAAKDAKLPDAGLLLAARTLALSGDPRLIGSFAIRIFARTGEAPLSAASLELYDAALKAISKRGDQAAREAVASELVVRKSRRDLAPIILSSLSPEEATALFDSLSALFLDESFAFRDELRAALLKAGKDLAMPLAMKVARAGRQGHPRIVRKDAMLLLGALKPAGALLILLENLPALPVGEAIEFAPVLAEADPEAFARIARRILDSVDAPSRAALIAALPAIGAKPFMTDLKKALDDPDPDVRAAAARALAALDEGKALTSGALGLLRDPVERVREASAAALAEAGGSSAIESLRTILADQNEVDEVKLSLIEGLGAAGDQASLGLLLDTLDGEWNEQAFKALLRRTSKRDLRFLAERFKDATGEAKSRIAENFKRLGEVGEEAVAALLMEDIPSLRPVLAGILEESGWVDARIRELKRRDPAIRRAAAAALQSIGTPSAYRGIVMAARDPDREVRAAVAKALERLGGPDGTELLERLEHDPDPKIRKYALWALERVKSKEL
ncbi:MAG: HEAT repeat domain-containing protein [Spirochaetales bacterium]|nr:HEAT repeat domain-containing protein [Spirochaetales bacterium]